jgi:hypothetical protein
MNEMVPSDCHRVAITHDYNHFQAGLCKFYSRGKGEGPAMGRMKGIEVDIDRKPSRTSDPGDENHFIFVIADPIDGPDKGPQHDPDPASGTPDMRKLFVMPQILMDEFGDLGHQDASMI